MISGLILCLIMHLTILSTEVTKGTTKFGLTNFRLRPFQSRPHGMTEFISSRWFQVRIRSIMPVDLKPRFYPIHFSSCLCNWMPTPVAKLTNKLTYNGWIMKNISQTICTSTERKRGISKMRERVSIVASFPSLSWHAVSTKIIFRDRFGLSLHPAWWSSWKRHVPISNLRQTLFPSKK